MTSTPITSSNRTFALIAHLGGIFTVWLVPLVIYLVKKSEPDSEFAATHAKESLNFHLTVFLVCMVLAFTLIGWLVMWIPGLWNLVLSIVAAVKASNGEAYRYPMTLRLIK